MVGSSILLSDTPKRTHLLCFFLHKKYTIYFTFRYTIFNLAFGKVWHTVGMKVLRLFILLFFCTRTCLRAEERNVPNFYRLLPALPSLQAVYPDYEYFKVYPNPAEELLTVEIGMKLPARISIRMLSSEGELIRTLANDLFPAGRHFFETTLNSVPSGTYVIRYEKGDKVQIRRVVIK